MEREQPNQGKVLSVRSSVVDVRFPDKVPPIRNVLKAGEKGEVIIEVFTQLDSNTIRGVSLTPTQGLARGSTVTDTGKPFEVPVGKELLGRVFNVFGDTIDKKGSVEANEYRCIHRDPIPLQDQSTVSEIFETGIKAIDVLAPLERGG
ncbi:MAG: ATP synthase F0F1 subunit beta, partial [Deltaproteobacteria bacterium]|nr:ATP synthase F0F1 subunit beta [Deltaproteobacteria bacterium]